MGIKSERLEKRIQEVQQFVNDKIERDPIFAGVYKEIQRIANTLNQGKLTVQNLGTLNERKAAEDIILKQVTTQLSTQLTLIENFLINQHRELEIEHQQAQASLPKVGGDQIRRFDETIRLINPEKASVIKEIKNSVNKSGTDLLDRFLNDSIICQLHSQVYALESEILKQKEGHIYIRLVKKIKTVNKYCVRNKEISNNYTESTKKLHQINKKNKLTTNSLLRSYFRQSLLSKLIKFKSQPQYRIALVKEGSVDANTVLTDYYRNTLSEWAAREWNNVCNIYARGGLGKLFQITYERLKSFPYLNIESSDWEPSQYIDINHLFVRSTKKPDSETYYRKISLLGFIFGRIRSNLMPFLSICFVLSILGVASKREIARWFFQPVFSAYNSARVPTIIILLIVIYFLLKALFQTYKKHNLAEMKKAEVKLKDEIFQFYSDLIKHLTDKVRLEILSAIETKEDWMDENIQAYRQLIDQTSEAAERNQPLIKKRIEEQKEQLKKLNQELGDLQRLKRNLN